MKNNEEQTFQQLRESLGLTQNEAANKLGVTNSAIQQLERREKKPLATSRFSKSNRRNYYLLNRLCGD